MPPTNQGTPGGGLLAKLSAAVEQSKAAASLHPKTTPDPTGLIIMCPPTYLDNSIPNNTFMESGEKEAIDRPRAMRQFQRTKHLLQALGQEVKEIPAVAGNQDQIYVANVACAIQGPQSGPVIVLANYKAAGRSGEVPVAKQFFEQLGYRTIQPPFYFEGEADLKKLNPQLYIGGTGQFSDERAYSWIEDQTGIQIIRVEETDERLYHLDCSLMPIDEETILVAPEGLDQAAMRNLGQAAHLIVVPHGLGVTGVTNGVNIRETKTYLSGVLQPEDPNYRRGLEWLNETMDHLGYVVCFLDTDAYGPSGADLSCTVMHLDIPPGQGQPAAGRPPTRPVSPQGASNVPSRPTPRMG